MSATRMHEHFLTQPEIYGYRIASFFSFTGDSIFYVTPGKVKPDRRLLAVFSFIRRTMNYEPMLGMHPSEYLQYGFAKLENPGDPEKEEWLLSHKRKKGYGSVSWMEY